VENSHEGLDVGQEEEVETEIIRESDNQSRDTVILEQSQGEKPSSLETEAIKTRLLADQLLLRKRIKPERN